MTIDNCFEYLRWAESMMADAKQVNDVKSYWYLKGWIDEFNRAWQFGFCFPEYRDEYKKGLKKIKELCSTL